MQDLPLPLSPLIAVDKPKLTPYPRLVQRPKGKFNVRCLNHRKQSFLARGLYHTLLDLPFRYLLVVISASFLIINVFFALLYMMGGQCIEGVRPNSFADNLFFSVQTIRTIGYGNMSPISTYAEVIMVIESWCGTLFTAALMGLMFAKFSRPTRIRRGILFSKYAVINSDVPAKAQHSSQLVFRVTNLRSSQLVLAKFSLLLIRKNSQQPTDQPENPPANWWSRSKNHNYVEVRVDELNFEINKQVGRIRRVHTSVPAMPLPWTIVHAITPESPLYGLSDEELQRSDMEVVAVLEGVDELCGDNIQARWSYEPHEIIMNARLSSVLREEGTSPYCVDLSLFHQYEPCS